MFEGLMEILDFRRDFYRFLSSLFLKEVSLETLTNLSTLEMVNPGERNEALKGLIPSRGKALETIKEELDCDFARIFLGLGTPPAFPFESVYRSRLGLLMQEPFDEVREFYRCSGLRKMPNLEVPEDHIGIELDFMANLSEKAEEALKNDQKEDALIFLKRQKEFLHGHLSSWVPSFCKDIQEVSWSEFYKSLAELLNSWISSDSEEIDRIIGEITLG